MPQQQAALDFILVAKKQASFVGPVCQHIIKELEPDLSWQHLLSVSQAQEFVQGWPSQIRKTNNNSVSSNFLHEWIISGNLDFRDNFVTLKRPKFVAGRSFWFELTAHVYLRRWLASLAK